ncbi:hypothetical protein DV737_g4639, partial [Chaetothyriales sp. CBS 132003]
MALIKTECDNESRGSKHIKLEHLDSHLDAPDAIRRSPKREIFDHDDPVIKTEEDSGDESPLFISQPRTPSLIPSTGIATSPCSPTCLSPLSRSTSETVSADSTTPTPCPNPAPEPPGGQLTKYAPNCTCPVDLHCGAKANHLIDCRPLVPEGEQWGEPGGEPKPGRTAEDLPCSKEGEMFATAQDLANMVKLCNDIDTEPTDIDTSPAGRKVRAYVLRRLVARLDALTALLSSNSVHLHTLESSHVVPRVQEFLKATNAERLKKRKVPKSLREEMLILLRRWQTGNVCALPFRGLLRRHIRRHRDDQEHDEDENSSSDSRPASSRPSLWVIDPSWPFKRSAAVFGNNGCVNGQTWPNRIAMVRDGAHGRWRAGIHGSKRRGAYAVVMGRHVPKANRYADVDFGQTIYYIGTALKRAKGDTSLLPVRVFRSARASKLVPGRPKEGYRYDGLYRVVDYECLKLVRQIYRFKMTRLRGDELRGWGRQGPLRGWERKTGGRGGRK